MAEADQPGGAAPERVVGRYEILREIGRGGMAVVYVARQPDLERQVALKELGAFHAGSAEFAHRFLRESRLAGSLNHPNIVTVHEYFEHDGTPYIAMEYVPRGSLRPYMKRLSLAQIGGVLEGVLAGLTHAETAGIVHRDLKPENIMVTADGRVKITDFGIARATERAGTQYMTATGMTVGTPTYMAPEQAMAGDIGPWTDLYSVGVLIYELVVGHVPFHDTDAPVVILMRHVNERIPSPIEVRPDVDPALSQWIDSLLVKDPSDRVRHAATAWESFEDMIVGLLGPLWRRNARLLDDQLAVEGARPLTPAPFESRPLRTPTPAATTVPDAFVSAEAAAAAAPTAEEPVAAPPSESAFVTFGAPRPVAADTPPASAAEALAPELAEPPPAAQAAAPEQPEATAVADEAESGTVSEAVETPEFLTYGRPLPPPSAPAAPAEPPAAPEPEPSSSVPATPAVEPAPAAPEPGSPFETIAPMSAAAAATPEPQPAVVAAPAPPAPAEPASRSRAAPVGILALVLAAAAAAIGFLVAPTSKKPAAGPAALSARATAGPLTIAYPANWRRSASAPAETAALGLVNPVTLAGDASAPGGALVVGIAPDDGATLLPAGFAAKLPSTPQGAPVKLGSQTFLRYLDLLPRGASTPESIYALPTTRGTATAVCVEPRSNPTSFAAACERAIATLRTGGPVLPLGANPTYAGDLSAIVSTLNSTTAAASRRLAGAADRAAQAAAARTLSQANSRAAAALAKLAPGPSAAGANDAIVAALRRVATAYGSLATAAAANDAAGYSAARSAIGLAETSLTGAFAALQQAGYTLG